MDVRVLDLGGMRREMIKCRFAVSGRLWGFVRGSTQDVENDVPVWWKTAWICVARDDGLQGQANTDSRWLARLSRWRRRETPINTLPSAKASRGTCPQPGRVVFLHTGLATHCRSEQGEAHPL